MKAVVNTKELKRAVKHATSVLVKKPSHAALEALSLKVQTGKMYVGVMGDDITVVSAVNAQDTENGSAIIYAKSLIGLLQTESSKSVNFSIQNDRLYMETDSTTHGFKIHSVESLPLMFLDETESVVFETLTNDQLTYIAEIASAACTDNSARPVLRNLHMWYAEGQRTIEAADGYRMHITKEAAEAYPYDIQFNAGFVNKLVRVFAKSDAVELARFANKSWKHYVQFTDGISSVYVYVGDENISKYPDTARVAVRTEDKALISVSQLLEALERVEHAVGKKNGAVGLEFTGDKLIITSDMVKRWDMEDSKRVIATVPLHSTYVAEQKRYRLNQLLDMVNCFSLCYHVALSTESNMLQINGNKNTRCVLTCLNW